jgi:hypothetical protein
MPTLTLVYSADYSGSRDIGTFVNQDDDPTPLYPPLNVASTAGYVRCVTNGGSPARGRKVFFAEYVQDVDPDDIGAITSITTVMRYYNTGDARPFSFRLDRTSPDGSSILTQNFTILSGTHTYSATRVLVTPVQNITANAFQIYFGNPSPGDSYTSGWLAGDIAYYAFHSLEYTEKYANWTVGDVGFMLSEDLLPGVVAVDAGAGDDATVPGYSQQTTDSSSGLESVLVGKADAQDGDTEDIGAGTDAGAVLAAVISADAGAGADALAITALSERDAADFGFADDDCAHPVATITTEDDTPEGVDSMTPGPVAAETVSSLEEPYVDAAITTTETVTGADSLAIAHTATDAGEASAAIAIAAYGLVSADTGSAADIPAAVAEHSPDEFGFAAAAASVDADYPIPESVVSLETADAAATLSVTDEGEGADAAVYDPEIPAVDSGSGDSALTVEAVIVSTDAGAGDDAIQLAAVDWETADAGTDSEFLSVAADGVGIAVVNESGIGSDSARVCTVPEIIATAAEIASDDAGAGNDVSIAEPFPEALETASGVDAAEIVDRVYYQTAEDDGEAADAAEQAVITAKEAEDEGEGAEAGRIDSLPDSAQHVTLFTEGIPALFGADDRVTLFGGEVSDFERGEPMQSSLREIQHVVGARLPSLRADLRDGQNGQLKDLSAYASAAFRMVPVDDDEPKIDDASAVIESAPDGLVRYDWSADDVDTAGRFHCWFILTDGSGREEYFPIGRKFVVEFVSA